MELSNEQLQVVGSNVGGVKVVKAGAGSGKTRVIIERVKELIKRGYKPEDFLLITFTNKAGTEMKKRLQDDGIENMSVGTFHRMGMNELRNIYEGRGQVNDATENGIDKNFSIISPAESNRLLKEICEKLELSEINPNYKILRKITSKIRNAISYSLNTQQKLSEVINFSRDYENIQEYTTEISRIAKTYFMEKQRYNTMDYDDILFYWYQELMQGNGYPYKIIIIDEYQDSNALQDALAFNLLKRAEELFVVGDANQAIYGFRGSKVENIIELSEKVEGAVEFELGTNYRSDARIVKFAEQILKGSKDSRFHMDLHSARGRLHSESGVRIVQAKDQQDEADFIYEEIMDLGKKFVPNDEIAILYRSHRQSLKIEKVLYQNGVPYEMRSGKKFFERGHVLAVLGYLRIIRNPADKLAWLLILEHKKGIGAKSLVNIETNVLRRRELEHFANTNGVTELVQLIETHVKSKDTREFLQSLLVQVLKARTEYVRNHERDVYTLTKDGLSKIHKMFSVAYANKPDDLVLVEEDLKVLESDLVESKDIDKYIDDFYLIETNYLSDAIMDQKKVTLSTVHRSKGLEWDYVFVVGANYREFPSMMNQDYDEERRLFYVASTRARVELTILHSKFVVINGAFENGRISPLLTPVPESFYDYYTLVAD